MSVLRSHYNKTRGGLGRVCATGMYRSIERVKFPKFRTGIFVEWKAPLYPVYNAIGLIFALAGLRLTHSQSSLSLLFFKREKRWGDAVIVSGSRP